MQVGVLEGALSPLQIVGLHRVFMSRTHPFRVPYFAQIASAHGAPAGLTGASKGARDKSIFATAR